MKMSFVTSTLIYMIASLSTGVDGYNPNGRLPLTSVQFHVSRNRYCSVGFLQPSRLLASDDNAESEIAGSGDEVEDLDSYDFEAEFKNRMEKEGGATKLRIKNATKDAAKGAADTAGSIKSTIVSGLFPDVNNAASKGLVTDSGWNLTLASLALIIVLAVGTQVMQQPIDTNGEVLGFGIR
uniref:Uncharacterized protein n=1 Tax=Corethron hystrix TaxID=216773 RepID=A0A7S1B9T9_9STRA|mmetsp:Transcript_18426/g.42202  ORF Transcript_18426/g.42202 Transcript_18426/m.42202 type:complete len:181 (+) Transcript_18426:37-579(+)